MSTKELVMHDTTSAALEAFVAHPSQAVLLSGQPGVGHRDIAVTLAARILGVEQATIPGNKYVRMLEPEEGTIKIERVRELQNFFALKVAGHSDQKIQRIVIIYEADTLSHGAQNAFLKLLEEPPEDTLCILSTTKPSHLLPTIRSRCHIIRLVQPTLSQAVQALTLEGYQDTEIKLALMKTDGSLDKAREVLEASNDDAEDVLYAAKQLLKAEPYQRLLEVDVLSKDKARAISVIDALNTLARAAAQQAIRKGDDTAAQRWVAIVSSTLQAQTDATKNGNLKLILSDLLLTL